MTAFNVVRFKVKPGHEEAFLDAHRRAEPTLEGFRHGAMIKTGDRSYCLIGEWDSYDAIAAARPRLVAILDGVRADLEDLGHGLGVTDPVSGEVVLDLEH